MKADRVFFFPPGGATAAPRKEEVIRYLCEALARGWKAVNADILEGLVTQRESALSTRLSPSLAVPHAVVSGTGETHLAAAVIPGGVQWDTDREHPVRLVMLLAGGRESHLGVLSKLARRLRDDTLLEKLVRSETPEEFLSIFLREGEKPSGLRYYRGIDMSAALFEKALFLRDSLKPVRLVLHADALGGNPDYLRSLVAGKDVLVVTSREELFQGDSPEGCQVVFLPFKGDRRPVEVQVILLYLLSVGMIKRSDLVIYLRGRPDSGFLDTLRLVHPGWELDLTAPAGFNGSLTGDLDLTIFHRVVQLALELAAEGREGKPLGTIFVVGDKDGVMPHATQMIANPFHGYPAEDRNILDPGMEETIKEYAKIDGAFIVGSDGTLEAAGAYLSGRPSAEEMQSGLGARHAAAQGITAVSDALAVVISESTRKVTVFRGGKKVMEL